MERQSLGDLLRTFVHRGQECAYVQRLGYRSVRWSYHDVARAAFRFARELDKRGIHKGDRVLIWGPNSAEWVATFLGCALSGVIAVPIDEISTPEFALKVYQQVNSKLLVCSREHQFSQIPTLVLETLNETLSGYSTVQYQPAEVLPGDTLEIVFTSGTTSEPKGVVITHGNVLANLAPLETEICKYLKYERLVHPIRFLNLLPLSHVFGQFLGIFLPQSMGGTVVFQDELKPSRVIDTIRRERVSVLVAVPHMLQSLREKIESDLADPQIFKKRFHDAERKHFLRRWWIFRRIRHRFGWKFWAFICGGAALDSDTEQFWQRLGYAVIQGYGLTETTSLVSVNHPFRVGKGSIGKVLAGREVKLNENGEILIRGKGVASSYWTAGGLTSATAEEGWYHTGDLGEIDADGNLYFKGRTKDVIVTPAGMKVYPEDLEAALRKQGEVKDCVVISLPQNENAEPCAVLILRRPNDDPEAAVKRANETLADFQQMRKWHVWGDKDFPRTSTQKPRRNVIRDTVMQGKQSSAQQSSSAIAELVQHITGRTPSGLSSNSSLENDLNLTSMDRVALLGALEDRYQIDLNETGLASLKTIQDVERLVRGNGPTRTRYHYPRWAQRWPLTWIRAMAQYLMLRPAVFLLGRPRIEGKQNLANIRGPALVVCNHISDVDPGFVIAALAPQIANRLAIATAGEELEALRSPRPERNFAGKIYDRVKWLLGVSLLNLFPLPRESGFRESFAYAGECVDRGFSILVFPEGRHTPDGKLLPFRSGIGLLVHNLNIPVIPIRIDGLFDVAKEGRKFARPGEIRVILGPAVAYGEESDVENIAEALHRQVERL